MQRPEVILKGRQGCEGLEDAIEEASISRVDEPRVPVAAATIHVGICATPGTLRSSPPSQRAVLRGCMRLCLTALGAKGPEEVI